ncbi:MAG: hypothetical protein ACYTHJ_14995 [Planctomycetota bacterium]
MRHRSIPKGFFRSARATRPAGVLVLAIIVLLSVSPATPAAAQQKSGRKDKEKPAEETRMSSSVFRAGLRKRGLTELLDLHLVDFPPAGKLPSLLMRRDLRLSEFADTSRPLAERRNAIATANRLLEEAIQEAPRDKRRWQWMFDLTHALIYKEAEPYYSSILYRGGNEYDRSSLSRLTERAAANGRTLAEELRNEYDNIDNLSLGEFERLEQSGHIEMLDTLTPRAEYLLAWTLFYDALPRDDDAKRSDNLQQILEYFRQNAGLLETPHDQSKVQVQAYLLVGMTNRLLNDHPQSRDALARAVAIANRIDNTRDRDAVRWAALLGRIEAVRNESDAGRLRESLNRLEALRKFIKDECNNEFSYRLILALQERELFKKEALSPTSSPSDKRKNLRLAWRPLFDLRARYPNQRDEINAAVFDLIEAPDRFSNLDPIETAAVVAGLLTGNQGRNATERHSLQHVIDIGTTFVEQASSEVIEIVPEVLYNVAVAHYLRGEHGSAAQAFLQVAREHPTFDAAHRASVFAVELAFSFYDEQGQDEQQGEATTEVRDLYLSALETLLNKFPKSDEAKYWRFYYAQSLYELGRFEEAEPQFGKVHDKHQQYLRSVLLRLRCMANSLRSIDSNEGKILAVNQRIDQFQDLRRDFARMLQQAEGKPGVDDVRQRLLRSLGARALLLDAEVQVLKLVNKPANALNMLSNFEETYPELKNLSGRVWKVRLLSFEKLGRIDEAANAIPAFLAADPENAGPTLQVLYQSLSEQARTVNELRTGTADKKALLAVLLAEQVYAWSTRTGSEATAEDQRQLLIQLAGANLHAGQFQKARDIFEQCGASPGRPADERESIQLELETGYAETLYKLEKYDEALVKFNRLATGLAPDKPERIKCLLRDLQCRTALEQTPEGIIKVIKQQRYLHDAIEKSPYAPEFDRLLRENQRRAESTP